MIQVGEVLDKYELLERVGQGGMAVVYRGLDRSLKRVVAVKILHKHLSDYQEARDRFEREAQAVAKLRHENILEIFDYSGADEAKSLGSSYIVTEFIEGSTLKQAITDRPIQYPEIGAMIILQVCRALAHAHAAGVLHRDVKPENVMIRTDGVVKLMDFGISHMLDLERLTVTGQLLGSPAYMAPEHVEGRQLDFRTDVFAAGIVLYQLTVGRLPFEGKNPHEVLKRIAECKFTDPRQANPVIGNRLGRIILRAMAAEPNDRYPNIGEMVLALEAYLEESGVVADKVPTELARYFVAPVAYEQAFEIRLVDHLTVRGTKLLADNERAAALDVFDRILTVDPDNEKVLKILDGINRRRRVQQALLGTAAVAVIAFCAYMVHRKNRPIDAEQIDPPAGSTYVWTPPPVRDVVRDKLTEPPDAGVEPDAVVAIVDDARGSNPPVDAVATIPDTAPVLITWELKVIVSPRGSEIYFGDGTPVLASDGVVTKMIDRDMIVRARHPKCEEQVKPIKVNQTEVVFSLEYKPSSVVPRCKRPGLVDVRVDNKSAKLDGDYGVYWDPKAMIDSKKVTVEFVFEKETVTRKQTVTPAAAFEVSCD
ncbi:MAG: serine/threonine protein kinase [Deltaproteobacteria bacterium]|nr:serine/threonine protein kinase [Deltaproteobacteria bacterium]